MLRIISDRRLDKEQEENPKMVRAIVQHLVGINPSLKTLFSMYLGMDNLAQVLSNKSLEIAGPLKTGLTAINRDVLITPEQLVQAQDAFRTKYPSGVAFDDVGIEWPLLRKNINEAFEPVSVAYKFIHRCHENRWYLTAQRGKLDTYGDVGNATMFKGASTMFFDIDYSGLLGEVARKPQFDAVRKTYYDQDYFDNVATADGYADQDRIWSTIIPAQELQLLIRHNLHIVANPAAPAGGENDYKLNFQSVSYAMPNTPSSESNVEYPHCIAVYASQGGFNYLVPGAVAATGTEFRGMAADMETLCPPNCNQYFWPTGLPA